MGNQQSSAQSKQEGHVVVEKELEQDLIEVEVLRMSSMDSEVTLDSYNVVGSDSESEYDEDDANEEEEMDMMNRILVLRDAKRLKQLAMAFLHPEEPVVTDATACARCYFDRPSAFAHEDQLMRETDDQYRQLVLQDASALKTLAKNYAHPELGVTSTSANSFARCYFNRPSAIEQESLKDASEKSLIFQDLQKLRMLACQYLHPEIKVTFTDPTVTARSYFDRPSAVQQESMEYAEERRIVLADVAALKASAKAYLHPEIGVNASSDGTATARCYFDRPSAIMQETVEYSEECRMILEDAAKLKTMAVAYLHPEIGVNTSGNGTTTARCYFDRPSAIMQETLEYSEERRMILEDVDALKASVKAYLHPEIRVNTSNRIMTARCYFDRPSAVQQETVEYSEERRMLLADALALKAMAVAYLHPEIKLTTTVGPFTSSRCYFDRPSALEQESMEYAEERRMIMEDAAALKTSAIAYLHPEIGVNASSDGTATARCYFDRPSAKMQETLEYSEERRMILADASALKELAVAYLHPEIGVNASSDGTAIARCYFDRPSALEQESMEYAEDRRMILADAAALKELAVAYLHPEIGVKTSSGTAIARCYFDRPSAMQQESMEYAEESGFFVIPKLKKPSSFGNDETTRTHKTLHVECNDNDQIFVSASAVHLHGLEEACPDPSMY